MKKDIFVNIVRKVRSKYDMILYDMCHLKVYQKVPRFSAATFVHVLQTPEKSIMTKYDDSNTMVTIYMVMWTDISEAL